MIVPRNLFLSVFAILLFAGSAWAGFALHASYSADSQMAQPGWCCIASERTCSVSIGADACKGAGGAAFNWDQKACNNICFQIKPKRVQKGGAAAAVTVPPIQ